VAEFAYNRLADLVQFSLQVSDLRTEGRGRAEINVGHAVCRTVSIEGDGEDSSRAFTMKAAGRGRSCPCIGSTIAPSRKICIDAPSRSMKNYSRGSASGLVPAPKKLIPEKPVTTLSPRPATGFAHSSDARPSAVVLEYQ
jgi:hypothetical protein